MPIMTMALQNVVPREDLGTATSTSAFLRSLGGALGVALSGAVVTARLHMLLPALAARGKPHAHACRRCGQE